MLILLGGPIGSGKTTLCQRLVDLARRRGLHVAGVLTPAVIEDGTKVGIEAIDLRTGEARLLARTDLKAAHRDRANGKTRVGRYLLDDLVLEWVTSLCEKALTAPHESAVEPLVFVDEIGRLELNRGGGLARLIPLLARPRARCAITVVRDTLLDRLWARVRDADPYVVTVNPRCREAAWGEMTRLVLGDRTSL